MSRQETDKLDALDLEWRDLTKASLRAQALGDFDAAAGFDRLRWRNLERERAIIEGRSTKRE